MNAIEIIREPCVRCAQTTAVVSLSECQECPHFWGYNLGETKICCTYTEAAE